MIKLLHTGLMVLLLMVVGCNRKGVPSTTTIVTDSTYVKEVPRYVEIKIPGDTVTVTEYIECDSATLKPKPVTIKAKNNRAALAVNIKATGELTATGSCDSLKDVIQVMDKEIFRLRHEKKHEVVEKTVYKTRGIDKFARLYTGITLGALLLYLIFKVKTFLKP
jgi:hypothetical protein